jgi:class 3 adenylate cyclase
MSTEKKRITLTRSLFLLICALVILLLYAMNFFGILDKINSRRWDMLIASKKEVKAPPDCPLLLSISSEDTSAGELGHWRWDHRYLANIVDFLRLSGARVIVFDFYFKEQAPGDKEFAEAIARHGKVVFGLPKNPEKKDDLETPPDILNGSGAHYGHVVMNKEIIYRNLLLFFRNAVPDSRKSLAENVTPSMALLAVRLQRSLEKEELSIKQSYFHPQVKLGNLLIPVLPSGSDDTMIINYAGPTGYFRETDNGQEYAVRNIRDVVRCDPAHYTPLLKKEQLEKILSGMKTETSEDRNRKDNARAIMKKARGNIVLIYNCFDPNDSFPTPYMDEQKRVFMPGGEIHAHEMLTLLKGKFISYDSFMELVATMMMLAIGWLLFSRPIEWKTRLLCFVGLALPWPFISLYLFKSSLIVTNIHAPLLCLLLLFASLMIYERKQFIALFGEFVSHRLKDEILKDASRGAVGTKEVEATIVFADIRGFSTFSEKLSPQELTARMTEYHTSMNKIFERNKGEILDYLGDAEMVGFGILGEDKDHGLRAIKSGLEMQDEIALIREKWNLPGGQLFEVGVGICTGMVAEGIVGSEGVKKQLVSMGDTTNTAARIQALSKDLDSLVTISESTYIKFGRDIIADPLKEMPLKGKTQKVMLYRVKGIREEALKRL